MKLLIADFLFVEAHKEMNLNFIKSFTRFANSEVVSLNGYYENEEKDFEREAIRLIKVVMGKKVGKIGARQYSLNIVKKTCTIAKQYMYDAIVCLGFETTVMFLGSQMFNNVPLIVFHHRNIDELTNIVKRVMFNCYKNRVYHVVFEEFFADRLTELGVESERIFVIPHPVKEVCCDIKHQKYDCVGLCNSNEESFIEEAISKEDIFRNNNLNILLRSKILSRTDGAVSVVKGFMEKHKYDATISLGKTVLVPLPTTYIYRLSGSIYDALARRKIVLTNSIFYAEEYGRRYPGICYYISTVNDLVNYLVKPKASDLSSENSFNKFLVDHSLEMTSMALESMIYKIVKKRLLK